MRNPFAGMRESTVRFCDRCSHVCDERCRRQALRERALLHQAWLGVRG